MSDAVLHAAPGQSASRTAWAMPLIPVAVSGFLLSAMTSLRLQGALPSPPEGTLAGGVVALYRLFGFEPLFMVCVLTLTWSSIWFLTGRVERPLSRLARIGALGLSLAILVNLRIDGVLPSGGGELGALLATRLASVISPAVSIFAVAVVAVAALLLATDFFFYGHFERLGARRVRAHELDAVEPEVDAEEQAELESLALSGPSTASSPAAIEPVDAPSSPTTVSEGRVAATSEREEVEPEDPDEDLVAELGADGDEVEIWAIEEDLSSVTLLGPRRSEDETAGAVDAGIEGAPKVASAGAGPGEESSELLEVSEEAGSLREVPDALDADGMVDASSAEELPIAPQGAVKDEHEAAAAGFAAEPSDASASSRPDAVESAAGDPSASEDLAASGTATEADPDAPEQDAPGPEPRDVGEPLASLDGESEEVMPTRDATTGDADAEEVEAPAPSDLADQPVAAAEPIVELIPAPRVAPERSVGPALDPDLVEEAAELVIAYRRASANFLKRRLRIEDAEAMALLQVLAARGIIECEAGATQGRILGG